MTEKSNSKIFIGKVKKIAGKYGDFFTALLDNPKPTKADGTPDQHYKGSLIWIDGKTGDRYLVKSIAFNGVGENAAKNGFVYSLSVDPENAHSVEKL